jgi:hypothetical protein
MQEQEAKQMPRRQSQPRSRLLGRLVHKDQQEHQDHQDSRDHQEQSDPTERQDHEATPDQQDQTALTGSMGSTDQRVRQGYLEVRAYKDYQDYLVNEIFAVQRVRLAQQGPQVLRGKPVQTVHLDLLESEDPEASEGLSDPKDQRDLKDPLG